MAALTCTDLQKLIAFLAGTGCPKACTEMFNNARVLTEILGWQEVRRAVLPVLAKLLGEVEVREEVPHLLSRLLADNPQLQAAAADADAVSKLAGFLRCDDCSQRLKVPGAPEYTVRFSLRLCGPAGETAGQVNSDAADVGCRHP